MDIIKGENGKNMTPFELHYCRQSMQNFFTRTLNVFRRLHQGVTGKMVEKALGK